MHCEVHGDEDSSNHERVGESRKRRQILQIPHQRTHEDRQQGQSHVQVHIKLHAVIIHDLEEFDQRTKKFKESLLPVSRWRI